MDTDNNRLSRIEEHFRPLWQKTWLNFILQTFPTDIPWYEISANKNVDLQFVQSNPTLLWNWSALSTNTNITMADVLANLHLPWDWHRLSENTNLTVKILQQFPDKQWCWENIGANKGITIEEIFDENNGLLTKLLHWKVGHNPNLTFEHIATHVEYFNNYLASYCGNPSIDVIRIYNIYKTNPHKKRELCYWSSSNPSLPIEFVLQHKYDAWNWVDISRYVKITMEHINANPNTQWDWWELTTNASITMDVIENNPDKPWTYSAIRKNPNLTFHMYTKHAKSFFPTQAVFDNPFNGEQKLFMQNMLQRLLLMFMHNFYQNVLWQECDMPMNIERIFLDCFIFLHVMRY